jgi:hypothetical protein
LKSPHAHNGSAGVICNSAANAVALAFSLKARWSDVSIADWTAVK